MRWLLWKLGLVNCVVLTDFDAEQCLRIMRRPANRNHVGSAMRMQIRKVGLRPDGTIANCSYVYSWELYSGQALYKSRKKPMPD
jgi:hypothetical protein